MGKAKRFLGNQLPRNDRLNKALGRQSNTLRSQNITPTNQLPGIPNNDFLKSSGSLHSGADGFISQDLTIDTGILDLQANAVGDIVKVRKYININPESGTTDTLDLVASGGTEFPQQELVLVGQSGDVLTITHDSGSAAGNNRAILCPGAVAYTLNGTDAVALFYDFTLSKWRIEGDATSGGGGGAGFPLSYTVHDEGTHSGNLDHDLSLASGHKLQFTATADVDIDILNIPSGTAMDFYIEVTQDSTGGWAITANDAEWVNFPTLSTTADTVSLIACHADGDGNIRAITLLNASPTSGNFASKELDNLTTTSINTSLFFDTDATYDIGVTGTRLNELWANTIHVGDSTDSYSFAGFTTYSEIDFAGRELRLSSSSQTELTVATGAVTVASATTFLNVGEVRVAPITAPAALTISKIYTENLTNDELVLNAPTSGKVRFDIAGTTVLEHSAAELQLTGNSGTHTTTIFNDNATPNNGDEISRVDYQGFDSGSNGEIYVRTAAIIKDKSNTTEDGEYSISVMDNGTITEKLTIDDTAITAFDEVKFSPITKPTVTTTSMVYAENLTNDELVLNAPTSGKVRMDIAGTTAFEASTNAMQITTETVGHTLTFFRNDASPTPGDNISTIDFQAIDSGAGGDIYARIQVVQTDETAGTEDGDIDFYVSNAGTLKQIMSFDGNILTVQMRNGATLDMNGGDIDEIGALNMNSPTDITGSAGGNAALQNLLTALAAYGLITDSST